MISNDGQRLFDVCLFGPTIIGGPIVTVCGIGYILWILSPIGLLGILVFFLFYPVQVNFQSFNLYKSFNLSNLFSGIFFSYLIQICCITSSLRIYYRSKLCLHLKKLYLKHTCLIKFIT